MNRPESSREYEREGEPGRQGHPAGRAALLMIGVVLLLLLASYLSLR